VITSGESPFDVSGLDIELRDDSSEASPASALGKMVLMHDMTWCLIQKLCLNVRIPLDRLPRG
jgi:hypothetical protein